MKWNVYIVRCNDESYYTGITSNVERRIYEHNKSTSVGAKYTKTRRPVILVYCEIASSRSLALKREASIKRLSREQKEKLIAQKL